MGTTFISITALAIFFFIINLIYVSIKRASMSPLERTISKQLSALSWDEFTSKTFMAEAKKGNDLTKYFEMGFSKQQLSQIALAISDGVDVERFANPSLTEDEMRKIRTDLKNQR